MKFCAIICEYNPLHNGHIYHMKESLKASGDDAIFCVMSGNFSQRGNHCVFNQYTKAQLTLNYCDAVALLPTAYATQSAEIFALASIKLLNSFENISHLSFGAETNDLNLLKKIAHTLLYPTKEFKQNMKNALNSGNNYSSAVSSALNNKTYEKVLQLPNNMLAIEYLKALEKTKSKIKPILIKRIGEHNELSAVAIDEYISATKIREYNLNSDYNLISRFVPSYTLEELKKTEKVNAEIYNSISKYNVNIISKKAINTYFEVNEGIENYLKKTFSPTTRYKTNKINRTLLNINLGITKDVISKLYKAKKLPYIKLLGASQSALKNLKCDTNLIIRQKDIVTKNRYFKDLERIENNSNCLYSVISNTKLTKDSLYSTLIKK